MSLLYNVVQRKNPRDPNAAPLFYLEAVSRGVIDMEAFLDAVCEDNTLNRDEARMAINRAFRVIPRFMKLGFNIHLDEVGFTEMSIRSEGAPTEKEATAATATDVVPHFVFSRQLRDELKKTPLERNK